MNLYDYSGGAIGLDVFGLLSYTSGSGEDDSTEHINIYLPSGGKYTKYTFVHTVSTSKNANIWRVGHADETDSELQTIRALTVTGEWECAVKISGRSDFSGGYLHGDETIESITFIKDGQPISDISSISENTPFNILEILQVSDLYDPNDSVTKIASHYSRHTFDCNKGILTISQKVLWKNSYSMENSYLAMFPIAKAVSSKYYTDYDYNLSNITIPVNQLGVSESVLIGDSLCARFAVSDYPKSINDRTFTILDNGGGTYNKCYYIAAKNGDTVENGTIWRSISEYRFLLT